MKWLLSLEMDSVTRHLFLDETLYVSLHGNDLRNDRNPYLLLPAMGKLQNIKGSLALQQEPV